MPSVTSCAYDRKLAEATVDELNIGTYSVGFIVNTDGLMGPQSVAAGALLSSPHPLPSLWSTYSYNGDTDALSYAREYHITRDPASVKQYYITVTYKPPEPGTADGGGGGPINAEPNPMERPPIPWWDREVYTKVCHKDREGKAIQNFARGLYAHDVEIEETRSVLVIEINVATLAEVIELSRTFDQAVNSSPWNIGGGTIPERGALCREVGSTPPISEHGYTYFRVSFRFAFVDEDRTWDVSLPEFGRFHWRKDGADNYISVGGQRRRYDAGEPIPLDEDGTPLPDDDEILFTDWRVRREVDFNTLPF